MTQHFTRNMSDAKNTLWGKCLSVFMSVAFAASTVSIAPVASALADETTGEEQASVMEEVSTVLTELQEENTVVMAPQSDEDGEGTEDGTEGTETEGTDEQGEDEIDTQSDDGIEVQSEDGSGAEGDSEEQGQQPEAPAVPVVEFGDGVLTITGEGEITGAMVGQYKTSAQSVVINGATDIPQETFAEFKMTSLSISNVDHIGYAFRSCTKLETLTIDNVGSIDTHAFYNPASLKTVKMTNVSSMGENVFNVFGGVTALESVTLDRVNVGNRAFAEHKNLTNVSFTDVGTIGFQAFMNCSSLTSVDLSGVSTIGASAFLGCTGLTKLNINGNRVENMAFHSCTGLETVEVTNANLGAQAFQGCTGLKDVTIEGSIQNIGSSLFLNCPAQISLTISGINDRITIPEQAFSGATAITSLSLSNIETVGKNAFSGCTQMKIVTMSDVTSVGEYAFNGCTGLKFASMNDVTTVGQYAFYKCSGLETVEMTDIAVVSNGAFWYCTNLTTVDSLSNVRGSIGGFAFYGCKNLTGLTVADLTKMGYIGSNDEIMKRVQAILAGEFELGDVENIEELTFEPGWAENELETANWESYDNGRQLMGQARVADESNGVAEVKIDAYYTAQKQMDYIFVADLSASMAHLGNSADNNARFYDMQSKLLDMTNKLLNTRGYDCQVAIVTFGGYFNGSETCNRMNFTSDLDAVQKHIKGLAPLNENTDYDLGLNAAYEIAKDHGDRKAVVVFLSDGAPTVEKGGVLQDGNTALDAEGKSLATKLKELVEIYGVLHSPTASQHDKALAAMQAVCSQIPGVTTVYESKDTESFGKAMNAAFASAYGENTVTVPVNDTQFEITDIAVTAGDIEYDGNGIITWTLNGMPFTQHTLTYKATLRDALADRVGSFSYDLNNGDIEFGNNEGQKVSLRLSLNVSHTSPAPEQPGGNQDGGDDTPVTPVDPVDPNPVTPIDPVDPTPATPVDPTPGIDNPVVDQPDVTPTTPLPAPDDVTLPTVTIPDAVTPLAPAPAAPAIAGVGVPAAAPAAAAPAAAAPTAIPGAPVATIVDDDNPLAAPEETTIEDDENALIGFEEPECQMHWFMSIGLIVTLIYGFFIIKRRKDENDEFIAYEHSITHRR